jgi:hypothetical protein
LTQKGKIMPIYHKLECIHVAIQEAQNGNLGELDRALAYVEEIREPYLSNESSGYETTVNSLGEWAICKAGAGDVIADLMTEGTAKMICDALNKA